jgi:hypothetical protein
MTRHNYTVGVRLLALDADARNSVLPFTLEVTGESWRQVRQ